MIDSHCHLADKKFTRDLDAVLARAKAAGVTKMLTIADSLEESETCIELAQKFEQIYCTVGVHPHRARAWSNGDHDRIRAMVKQSPNVVAIGEIGLDYHYNSSPKRDQLSAFSEQLQLAQELNLPVVIHCREAVQDVWDAVKAVQPKTLVLHCCTERWDDVQRFVGRGYLLSFTGIATYPNAEVIRDTIRQCPLSQLMLETDAPYVPPEALRAKGGRSVRNEPAFVVEVAKLVAQLKGLSLEEVDRITTRNTVEFFGLSGKAVRL